MIQSREIRTKEDFFTAIQNGYSIYVDTAGRVIAFSEAMYTSQDIRPALATDIAFVQKSFGAFFTDILYETLVTQHAEELKVFFRTYLSNNTYFTWSSVDILNRVLRTATVMIVSEHIIHLYYSLPHVEYTLEELELFCRELSYFPCKDLVTLAQKETLSKELLQYLPEAKRSSIKDCISIIKYLIQHISEESSSPAKYESPIMGSNSFELEEGIDVHATTVPTVAVSNKNDSPFVQKRKVLEESVAPKEVHLEETPLIEKKNSIDTSQPTKEIYEEEEEYIEPTNEPFGDTEELHLPKSTSVEHIQEDTPIDDRVMQKEFSEHNTQKIQEIEYVQPEVEQEMLLTDENLKKEASEEIQEKTREQEGFALDKTHRFIEDMDSEDMFSPHFGNEEFLEEILPVEYSVKQESPLFSFEEFSKTIFELEQFILEDESQFAELNQLFIGEMHSLLAFIAQYHSYNTNRQQARFELLQHSTAICVAYEKLKHHFTYSRITTLLGLAYYTVEESSALPNEPTDLMLVVNMLNSTDIDIERYSALSVEDYELALLCRYIMQIRNMDFPYIQQNREDFLVHINIISALSIIKEIEENIYSVNFFQKYALLDMEEIQHLPEYYKVYYYQHLLETHQKDFIQYIPNKEQNAHTLFTILYKVEEYYSIDFSVEKEMSRFIGAVIAMLKGAYSCYAENSSLDFIMLCNEQLHANEENE